MKTEERVRAAMKTEERVRAAMKTEERWQVVFADGLYADGPRLIFGGFEAVAGY